MVCFNRHPVEADLGWKDGAGRLMLFTCPDDNRPVAVMIPAAVANGIQRPDVSR